MPAQFEYQEIKVLLDTMEEKNIKSWNLQTIQRNEIEKYIRTIVTNRPSIPSVWIPSNFQTNILPGTTWRQSYSSESTTLSDLPRDATIYISFIDDTTLQYKLQFSNKTFGLKSLQAICNYNMDTSGTITFVYDKISTDMFGMANINLNFLTNNFLKGRVNYIEMKYFDTNMIIEQGYSSSNTAADNNKSKQQESDFFNVYTKVLNEEKKKNDLW